MNEYDSERNWDPTDADDPRDWTDGDPDEIIEDDYDDYEEPYECDSAYDADALASAGWGTDEDYDYYGNDFDAYLGGYDV